MKSTSIMDKKDDKDSKDSKDDHELSINNDKEGTTLHLCLKKHF